MVLRMTRREFLGAAAGAAAAGLAAARAAGAGEGRRPWRHATIPPRADSMFQLMAQEKGFYREVGLDVEMVYLESGATVVQMLVASEVDTIDIGPSQTLVSIARGAKLKIVGSTGWAVPYVLYAKADVKTLKDLGGRTIAISQPGALAEVLASALLAKEGLDTKAIGVQWVSVGGDAARMQALLAGRVDATIDHVEFMTRAQQAGFKVLASVPEVLPNYIRFATVTSEKVLRDRFEDLVHFCTALTRGIRHTMEHRDETIDLGVKAARRDRDEVARTYDWFAQNKALEPNFLMPAEGLRYLQELNVRLGTQARVLAPEEVAAGEVQKRVVAALAPFKR
jgi:NitT/TauT family transport system substrate-binding protein